MNASQITYVRRLVESGTTYGQIENRTGISALGLHCLIHFCHGLSPSRAANRVRGIASLNSGRSVNGHCLRIRQYRRFRSK